jgi:hypothetical protein
MPKQAFQRGSFNLKKSISMSKLIECLTSAESWRNLLDRLEDEDEDLEELGLTYEIAEKGFNWWQENSIVLTQIIERLTTNLEQVANNENTSLKDFLNSWNIGVWSDFIRETFDTIWNFGDEDNYEYFFNYAVRQSLGYNLDLNPSPQESENFQSNQSPALTTEDWDSLNRIFRLWWNREDVYEIFSWVFEVTRGGQKLLEES